MDVFYVHQVRISTRHDAKENIYILLSLAVHNIDYAYRDTVVSA
jgi:hypothetical protein